jgi:hypothetical protein
VARSLVNCCQTLGEKADRSDRTVRHKAN